MSAAMTAVPPAVALVGLGGLAWGLPRRLGHAVGVLGSIGVLGWLLAVPAGAHLAVPLFGFDAVLFNVDPYSRLLGLAFGVIAAVAVGYSYATGLDRRQTGYSLAYLGAGTGAALAGDWLTLVVFWELMALMATVLIWHQAADRRVGIRYAIYHELGGLALAAGVLLHFAAAGTFVFGAGITGGLPAVLVALGIGLNAGFLGLHVWIVDTYPRTHVAGSVVLAAVTTKVGAYAIVRAFPDGSVALAYVGGAMVLFGVTMAILQSDMRRLLSYHIVSQVGYIVAGFAAGAALASAGAMGHLVNNILYKSLLFMVAGIVIHRTGRERLKAVGGLARELPGVTVVFLVAALSIAGVPGFNGFISKGMILDGVEKAGLEPLWWALLLGGIGTVISFAKFGYSAFLHGEADREYADLSAAELGALGSVAVACVLIGLAPALLFDLLPGAGVAGAKPFAPKQFLKAGGVAAAGLIGFAVLRPHLGRIGPVPDLEVVLHPAARAVLSASLSAATVIERAIDGVGRWGTARARTLLGDVDRRRARRLPALDAGQAIGAGVLAIVIALLLLAVLLG